MSQTTTESKVAELRASWEDLKKSKPTLRIRDCAEELGVSEGELLATTVGDYTTRLEGDWTKLLSRFPELGRVMSLSRNDSCVLEHKGPFQKIDIIQGGPHTMATVIGPIETRVFFAAWKYGFAVQQPTPHGLQQSIQIFDEAGVAVTKVFLVQPGTADNKPGSNQEAYDKIVSDFKAAEQKKEIEILAVRTAPTKSIEQVNKEALLADWENMKDTHDFFGMLRKHSVNRKDAVVLSEGKFSYRLSKASLQPMLEKAALEHLPIMVFAGNRGNLQIHQGKIQTVRPMDQWLNILDPDFNMHLRTDHIESVWVVKKPTTDGVVTGIEVFDDKKEMIVQFFGLRKPGIPELEKWKELVAGLDKA
jgi:putative hemin transport protein